MGPPSKIEVRKVCVIGAGVSGLVSVKTCLEEGLEPVCLERSSDLGGVWSYKEKALPDQTEGQLYDCLVTNSSKLMMNYSDFPFPVSSPPYIPGREVINYYQAYADEFDIRRHIRFDTEVIKATPASNYKESGKWIVTSKTKDGASVEEIYDAVILCTGYFAKCRQPSYPGQEQFKGRILHSNQFRSGKDFRDDVVLVVGGSHSAGDVTVDCSYYAQQMSIPPINLSIQNTVNKAINYLYYNLENPLQDTKDALETLYRKLVNMERSEISNDTFVYLSMRHGAWVLQRNAQNGIPRDMLANSRIQGFVPITIKRWLTKKHIWERVNLYNLGLNPTSELFHSEVMVNDAIDSRILSGNIKTKPSMERFTPNGVVFTDGTKVENVDAVVFATGYELNVPFVNNDVIAETLKDLELYMHVFPPRLQHSTFAAVGFFETIGSHAPVMELQARWVCRVFRGYCVLPSNEKMLSETLQNKRDMLAKFGKHKTFFPPIPYSERLADFIGVKPNWFRLVLTDPVLAFKCFFGPAFPFSYRLRGPNTWHGAREAILKGWDDTVLATKSRQCEKAVSELILPRSDVIRQIIFLFIICIVLISCIF